ncbi:NUDIX hydrolase [Bordetella genomosp. 12]|uniref:NUDIX hydrolase n=1 Tax=Bordetella genomosp. 12 TaxID=463035 RepID=A0A261VV51_9BORD|nr:NUDIX hydrolase [Bordetella genomosp. 12]
MSAALRDKAQQPPPEHARPVYIGGQRCGWATLAACDALRDSGLVRLDDDALWLLPELGPGPALDAALADLAQTLRDASCLRGWRDELLDITAGTQHLGAIERAAMRPLGLPTFAVHLNAWTPEGRLWVARRALSKSTDPGMWDTLVGGLVGSTESLDQALVRECAEEAGLEPGQIRQRSPLRTVLRMQRRLPEGYQVEALLSSTCVLSHDTQPANRDGEVMEIATLDATQAVDRIEAGEFTLEAALVILEDIQYCSAA